MGVRAIRGPPGVCRRVSAMAEFLTIPEIIEAARAKLPEALWDYASGGSETETALG